MLLIIFCVLVTLSILGIVIQLKEEKDREKRKPKYRSEQTYITVKDPEHIDEFLSFYDESFTENDEFRYKQARLKNEYYGKKVYRYSPCYLHMKLDGRDVYSYMKENEWVKVGTIEEDLPEGEPQLLLIINEYKDVKNTEFKKVKGDPYFTIRMTKRIKL